MQNSRHTDSMIFAAWLIEVDFFSETKIYENFRFLDKIANFGPVTSSIIFLSMLNHEY